MKLINKISMWFGRGNTIDQSITINKPDTESSFARINDKIKDFKLSEALDLVEEQLKKYDDIKIKTKFRLKKCDVLLWQGTIEKFKEVFLYTLENTPDSNLVMGENHLLYSIIQNDFETANKIKRYLNCDKGYTKIELEILETFYNCQYEKIIQLSCEKSDIKKDNVERMVLLAYYLESTEKDTLNFNYFDHAEKLYLKLEGLSKIEKYVLWSNRVIPVINSFFLGTSNTEKFNEVLKEFLDFYKVNKDVIEKEKSLISTDLINSYIHCLDILNKKDELERYLSRHKEGLNPYNYCLYILINEKSKLLILDKFNDVKNIRYIELGVMLLLSYNKNKDAIKLLKEIEIESVKTNDNLYLFWIKNRIRRNKILSEEDIEFLKKNTKLTSKVTYLDYKINVLNEINREEVNDLILNVSKSKGFNYAVSYLSDILYQQKDIYSFENIHLLGEKYPYVYRIFLKKMDSDSDLNGIHFENFLKKIPNDEIEKNGDLIGELYIQFSAPKRAFEYLFNYWKLNKNIHIAQKIFDLSLVLEEPKEEIYSILNEEGIFEKEHKFRKIYHFILVNRRKELIEATKLLFDYYNKTLTKEEANQFASLYNLVLKKSLYSFEENEVYYDEKMKECVINKFYKNHFKNGFSIMLESKILYYQKNMKKGNIIQILINRIFYRNIYQIKGATLFNIKDSKDPLEMFKKYSGIEKRLELKEKYQDDPDTNLSLGGVVPTMNLPAVIDEFLKVQKSKGTVFTLPGSFVKGERILISLDSIVLLFKLGILKNVKRGYIQRSAFEEIKGYATTYVGTQWDGILEQLSYFEENEKIVDDCDVINLFKNKSKSGEIRFEKTIDQKGIFYAFINDYILITENKLYNFPRIKKISNTLSFYFSKEIFYPFDLKVALEAILLGFKNFLSPIAVEELFSKKNFSYEIDLTNEELNLYVYLRNLFINNKKF